MSKQKKNILPYIYFAFALVDLVGIAVILILKDSELF